MNSSIRFQKGAITVEYLLVSMALVFAVWLAVVGGPGDWRDVDRTPVSSAIPIQTTDPSDIHHSSNLLKALDDRRDEFAQKIYEP